MRKDFKQTYLSSARNQSQNMIIQEKFLWPSALFLSLTSQVQVHHPETTCLTPAHTAVLFHFHGCLNDPEDKKQDKACHLHYSQTHGLLLKQAEDTDICNKKASL